MPTLSLPQVDDGAKAMRVDTLRPEVTMTMRIRGIGLTIDLGSVPVV